MSSTFLPIYLINIKRAADRRAQIVGQSERLGIDLRILEGIDGALVPVAHWEGVDHALFERRHGRAILPGEYGCYRSHLAALDQFLKSEDDAAIVIEDDVTLNASLLDRARAAMLAVPDADMIKLVNHRWKGFRLYVRSATGDAIGRCLFGPQGSTACYLVTRSGAEKILRSLAVMSLPWDVALERGWDTHASVYATGTNLVEFGPLQRKTLIGKRRDYLASKLKGWRRIPAHLFRACDFFRRVAYVLVAMV